ncbi:MAG TPA: DUF1232 domain-containing protein [Acidimicrobiales bacterium]
MGERLLVLGAVVAGLVVLGWVLLAVAARRLPPGPLRDAAIVVPAALVTVRRLARHPDVPRRAKVVVALAALWVASPIDLVPEFIPVLGPLDDLVVVALALRWAARRIPRSVLEAAWPGDSGLLDRVIG